VGSQRLTIALSPETDDDIEKYLKEKLRIKMIVCTRHKTKFNTYACFHISVIESEFKLVHNTDVWPTVFLIPPV
jgi:hypothetical protein